MPRGGSGTVPPCRRRRKAGRTIAITTRDQLIAAIAASPRQRFTKTGGTTVAGVYQSLWRSTGLPGVAATGPANGSVAALTNATTGAMAIPSQVNTSYLSGFDACANQPGTLILCDRIAEYGVNAAVNTAQTMAALTLPARATGLTDIELWLEVETALSSTGTGNISITYLNQAGTSRTTGVSQFAVSSPVGRAQPIPLTSGDTGVTAVSSITLNTASSGKFNAVLRRQICSINIPTVGSSQNLSYAETDLEQIGSAACLELLWLPNGTTAATVSGGYSIAMG